MIFYYASHNTTPLPDPLLFVQRHRRLMISVVNRHHHSNGITEEASESSWTAPLWASLSRYCGLRCQTVKLRHIPANQKHPNKEITKTPWRWRQLWEGKREAGMEEGKKTCVCVCVYEHVWGFVERNHSQLRLYSSHYRPTEIRAVVC